MTGSRHHGARKDMAALYPRYPNTTPQRKQQQPPSGVKAAYMALSASILADTLAYPSEEYDSGDGLGRVAKRRRLSNDSASEPPSSATSYSSYAVSFASASPTPSSQNSLEYPIQLRHLRLLSQPRGAELVLPPADAVPLPQRERELRAPADVGTGGGGGGTIDFLLGSDMHYDEADALFATYPHPSMAPPENSLKVAMEMLQLHPPVVPQEFGAAYEYHEAAM